MARARQSRAGRKGRERVLIDGAQCVGLASCPCWDVSPWHATYGSRCALVGSEKRVKLIARDLVAHFEEATEGEEVERREKLKTKWAQLEAVVGSETRVKTIARDLVEHFENRLGAMDGKAMIVCMSRRICIDLHRELVALRPGWHHADDDKGALKVVMTGSASDPPAWQPHIRNKPRREALRSGSATPMTRSASSSCATCG